MIDYRVVEIDESNISLLAPLNKEALIVGEHLIEKTLKEWLTGENTFSKPGEKLWGLFIGNQCIAVGGLNIDPFLESNDGTVGRVRHVYVAKEYRRQGLSKVLMNLIINEARRNFKLLRLSTHNPIAASLYKSFGFIEETGYKVTHVLPLIG